MGFFNRKISSFLLFLWVAVFLMISIWKTQIICIWFINSSELLLSRWRQVQVNSQILVSKLPFGSLNADQWNDAAFPFQSVLIELVYNLDQILLVLRPNNQIFKACDHAGSVWCSFYFCIVGGIFHVKIWDAIEFFFRDLNQVKFSGSQVFHK